MVGIKKMALLPFKEIPLVLFSTVGIKSHGTAGGRGCEPLHEWDLHNVQWVSTRDPSNVA